MRIWKKQIRSFTIWQFSGGIVLALIQQSGQIVEQHFLRKMGVYVNV